MNNFKKRLKKQTSFTELVKKAKAEHKDQA
jgi:hypothetical protein